MIPKRNSSDPDRPVTGSDASPLLIPCPLNRHQGIYTGDDGTDTVIGDEELWAH